MSNARRISARLLLGFLALGIGAMGLMLIAATTNSGFSPTTGSTARWQLPMTDSAGCFRSDGGGHVALISCPSDGIGGVVDGANPSATVGLSAVNGSAATFLRSDGAPALDPSIAPTWTGIHQFSNGTLQLKGATSGTTTLKAAATAGTTTLTFPGATIDFSATGGTSQVVKQTSLGSGFSVARLTCSDLSDAGAGCTGAAAPSSANPSASVGLSAVNGSAATFLRSDGAPALDQGISPTWSGTHQFNDGSLKLKGSGSGTTTLKAAATAGSTTLTFPGATTDFSATGGTSQVVKQTSSGGGFSVARLTCADLSDAGSGCTGSASSGGTVTSIATGFGLTGGPITGSGTVSMVAPSGDDQLYVSDSSSAATWRTLTNCTGAGKALTYATASNDFGCNTITSGGVTGSGTQNVLPKWDSSGTNLVDSQVNDDGTRVSVGPLTSPDAATILGVGGQVEVQGKFLQNYTVTDAASTSKQADFFVDSARTTNESGTRTGARFHVLLEDDHNLATWYGMLVEGVYNGTHNVTSYIGLSVAPSIETSGTLGTVTALDILPFSSTTATTKTGIHIGDSGGATTAYGLLIDNISGTTAYSILAGTGIAKFGGNLIGPLPSTQTITAGATIAADACGSVKHISSASAVTTSTSNTITAPASTNAACHMSICNTNASNAITLDSNSNIQLTGGADLVLGGGCCVDVVNTSSSGPWKQTSAQLCSS